MARAATCFVVFLIVVAGHPGADRALAADPVSVFLDSVDSLVVRQAASDSSLARVIEERPLVVGAAVARLLDETCDPEGSARMPEADARLRLASRIAAVHDRLFGTAVLSEIVERYRSWNDVDRRRRCDAKELESRASGLRGEGRLDEAVDLLEMAAGIYGEIGDGPSRAIVFGSLGVVHFYRSDLEAMENAYVTALALRRQVQNHVLEGNTLNGLGTLAVVRARWSEARSYYDLAIQLRRGTGDRTGLATSLTYQGNVLVQLGELAEAEEHFAEALSILRRDGTPNQIVEILSSTGSLLFARGRAREAVQSYEEALEICDRAPECRHSTMLLTNLVSGQRQAGRLREAADTFERALRALEDRPDADLQLRLLLVGTDLAVVLGEPEAARQRALSAIGVARDSGSAASICDALVNAGNIYNQLGFSSHAVRAAVEAESLAVGLGDQVRLRDARGVLASSLLASLRFGESLQVFTRLRDEGEEIGALGQVTAAELGRGAALSELGEIDDARRATRRALALARQLRITDVLWRALLNLGDTFERTDPDSASYYYERAMDEIEIVRGALGDEEVRTGFQFADRGRAYEEIVRYFAVLHSREPGMGWMDRAFRTAERAKARGLRLMIQGSDAADSTAWSPVTTAEMQAALGAGAVLMQYSVGDSASVLWIIDQISARMEFLPGRAELRRRVEGFRAALAQPSSSPDRVVPAASALYELLVRPGEQALERATLLVLVPDDILFSLPFEALVRAPLDSSEQWSRQAWLAGEIPTLYAPSSAVFLALQAATTTGPAQVRAREFLGFGDPDPPLVTESSAGEPGSLAPLPHAREEVLSIQALLGPSKSRVMIGAEASETEFLRAMAEATPRVTHVAAHGLVDAVEPLRSRLVLAPTDAHDGLLYVNEIRAMPGCSPLVVLSACESALGRLERGEGVVGLTQSFLGAGASGVVSSLWPVADASTAVLMRAFYEHMWARDARSPAVEALAHARRELIESSDWAHPFYWAAFVLVGNERVPW